MQIICLPASEQATISATGMMTGGKIRVIEYPTNLSAGNWLTNVIYYDQKGRPSQTQSENCKYGIDIVTSRYDFSGKVLGNYLAYKNPQATVTDLKVKTDMLYDPSGRLLETWKTINDEDSKRTLVSKNEYDQMGQLKKKELGRKRNNNGSYSTRPIETLDCNYHIRSWLKGINAAYSHPELISNTTVDRWFWNGAKL